MMDKWAYQSQCSGGPVSISRPVAAQPGQFNSLNDNPRRQRKALAAYLLSSASGDHKQKCVMALRMKAGLKLAHQSIGLVAV